jgi:4-amino-4-deoxy-L-arabinose transferase-like glycosyltransferase
VVQEPSSRPRRADACDAPASDESTLRRVAPLALAAVATPFLFFGLGDYGIVNGDEAYYHWAARYMATSGDWFRIIFTGENRFYDTFTHAPLFFWAKAALLLVLEDDRFSMRALSAGVGVVSVVATCWLATRLANARVGLLAGLVYLTTFQVVYVHGLRTGEMEPLLLTLLTVLPILFVRGLSHRASFWPHHLALVALVNLKLGLVLVPVAAEVIYFALTPAARSHFLRWLLAGAAIAPFGLSWHIYQATTHWDAFVSTVGSVGDQVSGTGFGGQHLGPLGNLRYYLKFMLWGGFPFSILYPLAIIGLASAQSHRAVRSSPLWRIVFLYAASVAGFYALVSVHFSWYVLALYPYLAVAAATWLLGLATQRPAAWVVPGLSLALGLVLWTRLDLELNPFATKAVVLQRGLELHGVAGIPAWLCITSTAVLLALLLGWWRRGVPEKRATRVVPLAICALLLCVATARVVSPVRFRYHVSQLEQRHEELEALRESGQGVALPLLLESCDRWQTRYFFAEHYELRRLSASERAVRGGCVELVREISSVARPGSLGP